MTNTVDFVLTSTCKCYLNQASQVKTRSVTHRTMQLLLKSQKEESWSVKQTSMLETWAASAGPFNNNQNQSRNVHLLWANQREREEEDRVMGCSIFTQLSLRISHVFTHSTQPWWFLLITTLEPNSEVEKEREKEINVDVYKEGV